MRVLARLTLVVVAVSLLPACTYFKREDADQIESTLAAAGFRMKPADTPARLAKLQAMPQRKLFSRTREGEPVYLYADAEFCKCLYLGRQAEYDRYQRLAMEKQIAQEQVAAAEMDENAAMDWGMWGPYW